jgi:probable HAF family extracellular repeat protein
MVDLGTLGGRQSSATAINDAGVIVGASEMPNRRWHAFLHDGTRMVDLGALIGYGSSFATDINSAGHVVGTVLVAGGERRSFVWRDGKMTVHSGGKGLHLTNSINDVEQVVGATYGRKLEAATMRSSAIPVVDKGGSKFLLAVIITLLVAAASVLYRRRYRGISLNNLAMI